MSAIITRATVVGGHDGRAEIEVELTYDNGGTSTISLDEEACTTSLDTAGVNSIDDLVGQPWSVVLPALERQNQHRVETVRQPSHRTSHQGDNHA